MGTVRVGAKLFELRGEAVHSNIRLLSTLVRSQYYLFHQDHGNNIFRFGKLDYAVHIILSLEPRMLENTLDVSGDIQLIIQIETQTRNVHCLRALYDELLNLKQLGTLCTNKPRDYSCCHHFASKPRTVDTGDHLKITYIKAQHPAGAYS